MSEHTKENPQGSQESDGTLLGVMMYLFSAITVLVSAVAALSALTGWKFKLEGAAIPGEWWFVGVMLGTAAVVSGTAWVYERPFVQRIFRNHKWVWFPLLGGIVLGCWGLIVAINIWDAGGFMMYAVKHGDAKKVESYLKKGNIDKATKHKMLERAVYRKHLSVVELMLNNGADANALHSLYKGQKADNHRVFYEACREGGLKMVKLFLAKGADVNSTTKKGESPLYFAVQRMWGQQRATLQKPVIELLLKKGGKLTGKLSKSERRQIKRNLPDLANQLFKELGR